MYKTINDYYFYNKNLNSLELRFLIIFCNYSNGYKGRNIDLLNLGFCKNIKTIEKVLFNLKNKNFILMKKENNKRLILVSDPQKMGEVDPQKMGEVDPQKMGEVDPQKMGEVDPQKMGALTYNKKYNIKTYNKIEFLEFLKNQKNINIINEIMFEFFFFNYPKKIDKIKVENFFLTNNKRIDLLIILYTQIIEGLFLYIEKWKIENTEIKYIPSPFNFIDKGKYQDEIYIDYENIKKCVSEEKKEEIKKNNEKEKEESKRIQNEKEKINAFFEKLYDYEKEDIMKEAIELAQKQAPKLKGKFLDPLIIAYKHKIIKEYLENFYITN